MFACVSLRSGAFFNSFTIARNSVQMGQPGAINARVRATKSRQNFSKPTHPILQLDPKLRFSCVSFRLGAFGTIMLLHETWCITRQTGEINAKVRAVKSCHNFSQ